MVTGKIRNALCKWEWSRKVVDAFEPEWFFFAGFIPYLIRKYLETTTFTLSLEGILGLLFTLCCAGLMLIKTVFFDKFSIGELVAVIAMLAVGVLTYVGCDDIKPMMLMVIIVSAKGVKFDKIAKVWLIISVSILVLAFVASQIGLIPNWVYTGDDFFSEETIIRTSFGICYPTDCAAHVFFTVLVAFYLRHDRLKFVDFLLAIAIGILVYQGTGGKLDSACILLTVIVFAVALGIDKCKSEKARKVLSGIWGVIGIIVIPVAAIAMIILTNNYVPGGELEEFNKFITERLNYGKAGFENYGVKLLGQFIKMYGGGGGRANARWDLYNFLDSSYINVLIVNGLIFFIMLMVIYLIIAIKNRKNVYMMAVLMLLAVNCFVAHHMMEIEYNIFTVALLAVVTTKTNEKEITELVKQTE